MQYITIKKSFVQTNHNLLLLISFLMFFTGSFVHASQASVEAKVYQGLMKLNGLVAHTYIDSLLYFDGDQRAQEGMMQSIVSIDVLLSELNSTANTDGILNAGINATWQGVKKEINSMPDETGYSYFYLKRLSGAVNEFTDAVDVQLKRLQDHVSDNDRDIYQASSEVLEVVSMHLSSAIMDIGNDEKSKVILGEHCNLADRSIKKVTTSHTSVKSYVLRSWRYIQAPICKTGKKGGEYTIAHFSKKISSKLQKFYGVSAPQPQLTEGGL